MPQNTVKHIIGGANRRLAPVHHQINSNCLIKITNIDNNCLFMAMQSTLVHATRGLNNKQFYNYMHSLKGFAGRFQQESMALKAAVGAPEQPEQQQEGYDATVWVPKIIDYWNNKGNGDKIFKAWVFQSTGW